MSAPVSKSLITERLRGHNTDSGLPIRKISPRILDTNSPNRDSDKSEQGEKTNTLGPLL